MLTVCSSVWYVCLLSLIHIWYLKNISDKTLSTNLKELEADALIVRTEYPQIPPKVEYTLSERGKSLMAVLDQLCVWGENNRPETCFPPLFRTE